MVNTGIIHILSYLTKNYLYEYNDISMQRFSQHSTILIQKMIGCYISTFCISDLDMFSTTCLFLKCCAHQEVKIAKGEVKQKSFITNEETFEGFLECNYSLQFFDNIMIVM